MGLMAIGDARIANQGIESRLDVLIQDDVAMNNARIAEHAELLAEMKKQTTLLEQLVRQNGGAA